jgi:hypothetical protein
MLEKLPYYTEVLSLLLAHSQPRGLKECLSALFYTESYIYPSFPTYAVGKVTGW